MRVYFFESLNTEMESNPLRGIFFVVTDLVLCGVSHVQSSLLSLRFCFVRVDMLGHVHGGQPTGILRVPAPGER